MSPRRRRCQPGAAELDASAGDRYWYDNGTGMLHVKLVTRGGLTSTNVLVEPQ